MENKTTITMDEFLQKGEETLKELNKTAASLRITSNVLKWLYGGIIVIVLALYTDTRIEVVKKIDTAEVQKDYITKKNTLTALKFSDEHNKQLIINHIKGDSSLESSNYEWYRDAIFDENYRGN